MVVAHIFTTSTQEAEAVRPLRSRTAWSTDWVLGHTEKPSLRKKKQQQQKNSKLWYKSRFIQVNLEIIQSEIKSHTKVTYCRLHGHGAEVLKSRDQSRVKACGGILLYKGHRVLDWDDEEGSGDRWLLQLNKMVTIFKKHWVGCFKSYIFNFNLKSKSLIPLPATVKSTCTWEIQALLTHCLCGYRLPT